MVRFQHSGMWVLPNHPTDLQGLVSSRHRAQCIGPDRAFTDMEPRVFMLGCVWALSSSSSVKRGSSNVFSHQI